MAVKPIVTTVLSSQSQPYTVKSSGSITIKDALGAQTINIATGATLKLLNSQGDNHFNLQGQAADYSVKIKGKTVTLTDSNGSKISIGITQAAQTFTFSDGSAVLKLNATTPMLGNQVLTKLSGLVTADLDVAQTSSGQFKVQHLTLAANSSSNVKDGSGADDYNIELGASVKLGKLGGVNLFNLAGSKSDYQVSAKGNIVTLIDTAGGKVSFTLGKTAQKILFNDGGLELTKVGKLISLDDQVLTKSSSEITATLDPAQSSNQAFGITPANINLSSLDGSNGFRLDGVAALDQSGFSVSDAGDVNGDGYDDVIVAANLADPNGSNSGASYLIFGHSSGFDASLALSELNANNGFRLDGATAADQAGIAVSSAGDINGDGYADLIIGAYAADPNGSFSGSSYLVFGKSSGFDTTLELADLDGNTGFRLDGVMVADHSGRSVSGAGDFNGDGFDDLLVGARFADSNGSDSGASYLVFGQASGFSSTLILSDLDGQNGFRLDGVAGDKSGHALSSAGDINGDGYQDLIIGAYGANPNGSFSGAAYVVFGKAAGVGARLDLSSLDGSDGFRLDGAAAGEKSGYAVSSAGDVNGDGYQDLIIGAYGANPNGSLSGASYVVFGKASGFAATLALSSLDGNTGFRLEGVGVSDNSGRSVSGAGDVNGDGFDDLLIGANGADPNGNDSGASYVVFGKASGFVANLALASLDGNSGLRLDGVRAGDWSGRAVSGAGDINGDGFADLLIGAFTADPNGALSGSSYAVFGGNLSWAVDYVGTNGNDSHTGTAVAERFVGGDGNDTLIGGGGADVIKGGAGYDILKISDLNVLRVDGGSGQDTLVLEGDGMLLNLSDVRGKLNAIEAIDLGGNGVNTLSLSALDVLNLSDTSNSLTVDGTAVDSVLGLSSGWVDGGILDGHHIYTQGMATVLVGVAVATDF